MVALLTCPSLQEMRRAMLGLLSDVEAEPLEEHIETCPACLLSLRNLKVEDAFTTGCRSGWELVEQYPLDTPDMRSLVNRVWELGRVRESRASTQDSTLHGPDSHGLVDAGPLVQEVVEHGLLAPAESPDEIGRLGGYRVLKVLGKGAMGIVFEAEDPTLQMRIALKVMLPHVAAIKEARTRFLGEAQAIASLQHDHVVGIFRFGEDRGIPFLVMPRLQGETVADRLRREKKLPLLEVLRIGAEIADGLAAAHARGRIHRDLKPSNLWLEAGKDRVKILDFGLVREMEDNKGLTQTNAIVGTVAYMAPEQIRGWVDARNDLNSLGCVLYEIATGQLPFSGDQMVDVIDAKMHSTPPSPEMLDSALPADFSKLVMRLLEKDADRRPQSATEVRQELLAITARISAGVELHPATAPLLSLALPPSPLTAQPVSEVRPQAGTGFRTTPPKIGRRTWVALAAAAVALLMAVFYLSTDYGEVRIEVADAQPGTIVKVVGSSIEIKDGSQTVRLRPGVHGLAVEGDDFKVVPETFTLKRGPNDLVKITLVPKSPPTPVPGSHLKATPTNSVDWTWALVSQPPPLKGVSRWTIEAVQHRGSILHFAFQPQGKLLATFGRDCTVRIWNLETGTLSRILVGNGVPPKAFYGSMAYESNGLAWSRSGKLLAVASLEYPQQNNNTEMSRIRIWNPETGSLVKRIDARTRISAVAFSPDESSVISLEEGTTRVWNLSSGALIRQFGDDSLRAVSTYASVMQFSPNGEYLAFTYSIPWPTKPHQYGLAIWKMPSGTLIRSMNYPGLPSSIDWSPDSKRLAVGADKSEVVDVASGARRNLPGEMDRACVRWLADGRLLAGSRRFSADLRQAEELASTNKAPWNLPAWGRAWSADGSMSAVLTTENDLEVYAVGSDRPLLKTSTLGRDLRSFANVSQDGSTFVFGAAVWNLQSNTFIEEMHPNLLNTSLDALVSPRGRVLWIGNLSQALLGYDPATRQKFDVNLLPKDFRVLGLGDSPAGVYGLLNGRLVCLDPADGRVLTQFGGTVITKDWNPILALTPDGKSAAITQPGGKILIWDHTGKLRNTITIIENANANALSWSADGQRLACAAMRPGNISAAILFNAETGKSLHTVPFPASVDRIAWSPDSRTVVFAGHYGETLELDAESGRPLINSKDLVWTGGSNLVPKMHVRFGDSFACALPFWNYRVGKPAGNLVRLGNDQWLFVAPNGHYRGVPEELDQQIRFVAETAEGQQTLSPSEFRTRFGWTNNPLQAEILSD